MTTEHDELDELLRTIPATFAQQKLQLTDEELARELSQSAGEQLEPGSDLMRLTRLALEYAAKHNS